MGCCSSASEHEKQDALIKEKLLSAKSRDDKVKKLLLLGAGGSGKSTFFKQLQNIHGKGFNDNERLSFKNHIFHQCIMEMKKLISIAQELSEEADEEQHTARSDAPPRETDALLSAAAPDAERARAPKESMNETLFSIAEGALDACEQFELLREDEAVTDEVADLIEILWQDAGILQTFDKRAKFGLVDSTAWFFDEIRRIAAPNYIPSGEDVLYVRHRTTGVVDKMFQIQNTHLRIFDVGSSLDLFLFFFLSSDFDFFLFFVGFVLGGQRAERKKWFETLYVSPSVFPSFYSARGSQISLKTISKTARDVCLFFRIHCFQHVTAVIYVASLSGYDEVMYEEETENVMHDSLNLFSDVCNNAYFRDTAIILFLNKRDLFADKINPASKNHVPLTVCFHDYAGPMTNHDCCDYVKQEFEARNQNKQKKIFVHVTCAMDRGNVQRVFHDVEHIVIELSLDAGGLI